MKTLSTKCIAAIALFAMTAGVICKADEAKLQLQGKTLMVYPILMGKEGIPNDEGDIKFGIVVGKNTAMLIEEYGMRPDISTEGPASITDGDSLAAMEEKFRTFLEGEKVESDYSLFARFRLGPSKHGPRIIRACSMLADSNGQVVWSEEKTEFPKEYSPMHGMMGLMNAIHSASDLTERSGHLQIGHRCRNRYRSGCKARSGQSWTAGHYRRIRARLQQVPEGTPARHGLCPARGRHRSGAPCSSGALR